MRCEARIAPYEAVIVGVDPSDTAREHRERLEFWSRRRGSAFLRHRSKSAMNWLVVCVLGFSLSWYAGLFGMLLGSLFLIGLVYSVFRGTAEAALCSRRAKAKRCPDCRYDLSGHADAIGSSLFDDQHVGPRRCTECGAPWPLVPPRLPDAPRWLKPRHPPP